MIFYEKIKEMPFDEMCTFILRQIHSDCHGMYDADCQEEGYANCYDCVSQMLNREVK